MSTAIRERAFSNRLTRLGMHCLLLGSFAMFGGAIRGFNLLLVLAALLTAALLMQWRWGRHWAHTVTVDRRLAATAPAGRPLPVRFRIHNQSRWFPVWMLRLEDRIVRADGDPIGDLEASATAACSIAAVPAGRTETVAYDCVIATRGHYLFGPVVLQSTFPFSLFRASQTFDQPADLIVLPKLLDLRRNWHRWLTMDTGGESVTVRRGGSAEGEFFGLREWQTGDSPKWIHWRTTARLLNPAVRQFEQQRRFDLCIVVDAYAKTSGDADAAEAAISLAATILSDAAVSPASRIVLGIAGRRVEVLHSDGGAGRRELLVGLAKAVVSADPPLAAATGRSLQSAGRRSDLIVISPRSQHAGERQFSADPTLRMVLAGRPGARWIDVCDPQIQQSLMGVVS